MQRGRKEREGGRCALADLMSAVLALAAIDAASAADATAELSLIRTSQPGRTIFKESA